MCNKYLAGLILLTLTCFSYGGDNLALLSGTLRTFHKTTCDSEKVTLGCPRGTSISIELAQYEKNGIDGYSLCPTEPSDTTTAAGTNANNNAASASNEISHQESCLWPNALQYSLLQTAIEACQKKTHCKFLPAPKSFGGNPCPGIRKIVAYAYKCRPYEFRSKTACENEVIQLVCNPFSRVAIYSASYGRTEYESIQCTQPQGVKEETCLVSYATETVMQMCHGRRRCTISADSTTFGNPCRPDSRMYLKTVYTCVPRKVLRESFDSPLELDELDQNAPAFESEFDEDDHIYKESEAIPPAPKLQGAIPRTNDSHTIGAENAVPSNSISTPNQTDKIAEDHHEELFYICLLFSIALFVLLSSIMIVIGRIVLNKRHQQNSNETSVNESAVGDGAMTKLQTEHTRTTTTTTATATTASTAARDTHVDENTSEDLDIDLTTAITISSISNRNNQHLYNTYTPSSYGNLEPSSISPKANLFNSNHHASLHDNIVRTSALHSHPMQRPQSTLRDLTALKFSPQTTPPPPPPMTHGFLIPAPNSTQTLNRHLQYQFNQALPMQSNTSPFAGCDVITSIIPAGAVVPMHTNPVNADTKYLYG